MRGFLVTLFTVTAMFEVTMTMGQTETTTTRPGKMCEKIVSERVPKVIRRTFSVLRKGTKKCGFLWLNTCSIYRVGIRTITRLDYTVKRHKVMACCNGTDFSGKCATDQPPECTAPGKYGPKCDLECNCERNNTLPEVCDKRNGYCFCKDGFGGDGCRQDLNQTLGPQYDPVDDNGTASFPPESRESNIAGGGDIPARVSVIVVVLAVIFLFVLIVFCCWKRRTRRKPASVGSTSVSDDFMVSFHPTQETAQYVTPEEVRKRKKEQEALKPTESLTEKPYDYVEMRNVGGAKPPEKPEVTSVASSQAHKILEEEVDSGRQSIAYANLPSSGSMRQDSDTSHYYLQDPDPKLSVSPTYSLMRRQESADSAYDDDGYCTSPTHGGEDINLHYSIPRYLKPKQVDRDSNRDSAMENIYESPEPKDNVTGTGSSDKLNAISNPEYANVSESINSVSDGVYSCMPDNMKKPADSLYDHLPNNISVV